MRSRQWRRRTASLFLATLHAAAIAGCATPRESHLQDLFFGGPADPSRAPAEAIGVPSQSTEGKPTPSRKREKDLGGRFSLYAWLPSVQGDLTVDSYEGETSGGTHAFGLGMSGEIRPRGWSASFDWGIAESSSDLGQEDVNPKYAEGDIVHTVQFFELSGGPCLFDLPEDGFRSDGFIGSGPDEGFPSSGGSRFRVDSLLGFRGIEHTVETPSQPDSHSDEDKWRFAVPMAGLRMEVAPVPGLAFHARGDAGGFGTAMRMWTAFASVSVRVARGTWITAGWRILSADLRRGDGDSYRYNFLLGGPLLSVDFWF